ncbi:hypothetical protein [Olleya sp. Bg11-27]|uniref:hypothetical protein n=1 Tax=Olleya sp. Bg11-27 TaxID=2058135 RepID=UPI000C30B2DF|nr:hypothetical protein [Olleya sp. Bg11-27]AUC76369.1 hypothetical protein CW732_12125 [Olleya sp. Bg11-27]
MKPLKLTLLVILCLTVFNCSDDDINDSVSQEQQQQFSGDFFPLTVNDSWNYAILNTNNDTNETIASEDVLMVDNETNTGFTLSVNQGTPANGTMSGILTSGELTRTETTLATHGVIGLPIDGFDFQIELENALLYNTQANNGAQLAIKTGTFTQDLQGYPITISYTLTSTQLENLDHLTVDNTIYDSITSANISLDLNATTQISVFGITQEISIIDTQEVLSINSFYAKNVGLIKAESDSGYSLNATTVSLLQQAEVDLSMLPTTLSVTNTQILTSYSITE